MTENEIPLLPITWASRSIGKVIYLKEISGLLVDTEKIFWKGVEYYTLSFQRPDGSRYSYTGHWTEKFWTEGTK